MADKDHLDIGEQSDAEESIDGILTRDDILAIIRRYEQMYGMTSEEFWQRWLEDTVPDTFETNSWAMFLKFLSE